MKRSLRVSLTSLLIALSLVPALAVGAALIWSIFQQERVHSLELERQVTNQAADLITSHLEGAEAELYSLIQNAALRGDDLAAREAALSDALFYHDTFDELALTDAVGAELSRVSRLGVTPPAGLGSYGSQPIFLEPMRANKTYFHAFEVSAVNGEPLLWMAVPTLNVENGAFDGVLMARVRMRQVFERVTSLPLGTDGVVLVADRDGRLVAHPDPSALAGSTPPAPPADGVATGSLGGPVLQVRRPVTVGNLALSIGAELPIDEADANMRRSLGLAAALLFGVAAVAAALCVVAVSRLVRPIGALAAATQRVSAGDTAAELAVTRQDEIGALQRDFNQMVADLRGQRAAVDERTAALQASLDRQRDLLETVALLSAPLLPVWDGVVVLPIVGHVDAQRGATLTGTLIEGVARRRARVAIIDITGLATLDAEVITTLVRAAQAIELLGARAMLAGVSAAFARRIVTSGLNLRLLDSYRDLQSATEAAIEQLAGERVGG